MDKSNQSREEKLFEFQAFYPFVEGEKGRPNQIGTCHIYHAPSQIDIRGIEVYREGDRIKVWLPSLTQTDADGVMQRFPAVNFLDRKTKIAYERLCQKHIKRILGIKKHKPFPQKRKKPFMV